MVFVLWQVETFGVSLNAEGTCFYGMQIEAVMDRIKDNISLDHLSRLLVDVQQDSSCIVDSIISGYQRDLLQVSKGGRKGKEGHHHTTPHACSQQCP